MANIKQKEIDKLKEKVEDDFSQLNNIIDSIIQPYCKDLDSYVLLSLRK